MSENQSEPAAASSDNPPPSSTGHSTRIGNINEKVLHIRYRAKTLTVAKIEEAFKNYGEIEKIVKPCIRKKYVFVYYKNEEDAARALEAMDKAEVDGDRILVAFAIDPENVNTEDNTRSKIRAQQYYEQKRAKQMGRPYPPYGIRPGFPPRPLLPHQGYRYPPYGPPLGYPRFSTPPIFHTRPYGYPLLDPSYFDHGYGPPCDFTADDPF